MVTLNLMRKLNELEQRKGRRYSYSDIANATEGRLSRQAARHLLNKQVSGVTFDTLSALLDFFESQGMPIGVEDLLSVEKKRKEAA